VVDIVGSSAFPGCDVGSGAPEDPPASPGQPAGGAQPRRKTETSEQDDRAEYEDLEIATTMD
jgi:hypothetical protein